MPSEYKKSSKGLSLLTQFLQESIKEVEEEENLADLKKEKTLSEEGNKN
jgi:hypothetical protein